MSAFDGVRTKTGLEDWVFTADYALPLLRKQFGVQSLDGMGLGGHEAAATAAGALVHYLQKTMQGGLEHIDTIRFYERSTCLILDAVSVRNLELVEPLFSGESAQTTLFHTLDECCTPMGKRLLRATLAAAGERAGRRLRLGWMRWRRLRRICRGARVCGGRWVGCWIWSGCWARVALDSAGPREVMALGATLACLPGVRELLRASLRRADGGELSSGISTRSDQAYDRFT